MDRFQVLTAPLKLSGTGLEIAPYFYPLLDRAKHDVRYVDCIDNDTIAKKAAENPGSIGREIPRIDWVWTPGKPLRSCVPADFVFDYCVATHVMEHVADTVGWLNQILDVMRDGAVLALALPDRRYTMDHYRRETTLGEVVGNWISAPSRPTSAQIVDFLSQSFYDTRGQAGARAFDLSQPFADAPRHYSDNQALDFAAVSHRDGTYLDVHCTVWTPASFVDVMSRVVGMGLMNVQISTPVERNPESAWDEFIIHLTKLGEPRISRNFLRSPTLLSYAARKFRNVTSRLLRTG